MYKKIPSSSELENGTKRGHSPIDSFTLSTQDANVICDSSPGITSNGTPVPTKNNCDDETKCAYVGAMLGVMTLGQLNLDESASFDFR